MVINIKNWIKLATTLIITTIASIFLVKYSVIDIDKILSQNSDFQYNAISMSAIIAGFLFTGISILISAIDKERIKRLWDNNYLDNLYRSAFTGMISNVVTIISAFILLSCRVSITLQQVLVYIEVITLIVGIVFFSWCIKQLIFILSRMKNDKN
ncbi:hypothetical protein ACRQV7_00820 [Caproiciproducens sp. R2]|uniref:hypothetical protein n=1 Tax=Caproiciproducens sp. R2 TaxID=3435187 RepID=UPI0040331E48